MVYDKCMFNHELLVSYSTGNADPAVRNIVERHLAKCSHCRDEVVELEKAWWALNSLDDEIESVIPQPKVNDLRARLDAINEPAPTFLKQTKTQARYYWNRYGNTQASKFALAAFVSVFAIIPWMQVNQNNTAPVQTASQPVLAQPVDLEAGFQDALSAGKEDRRMPELSIVLRENRAEQVGMLEPSRRVAPGFRLEEPIRPVAASYQPAD